MRPRAQALLMALLAAAGLASALVPGPGAVHAAPPALPQEGPDGPTVLPPDVVLRVFEDEYWVDEEGPRSRTVTIPVPTQAFWGRILLVYRQWPNEDPATQDPHPRRCSVAINGLEVLRCTTPGTDFTLTREITYYKRHFFYGLPATFTVTTGSFSEPGRYQGGQHVRLEVRFWDAGEPTGEAFSGAAGRAFPAWHLAPTCADGRALRTAVDFGTATAWGGGTIEVYLAAHGADEAWWAAGRQPVFHLALDGTEVAQVLPAPYTYASDPAYGGAYTEAPLRWWTAQRALDLAGIHTGVGELPPYRVAVLPQHLGLYRGVREVTLVGEGGGCDWPASAAFLLT